MIRLTVKKALKDVGVAGVGDTARVVLGHYLRRVQVSGQRRPHISPPPSLRSTAMH